MIEIPLFQDQSADFTQNIDLDSVNTEIRLIYNTRIETWMMHLNSANYTLNGIKLVKNFPLIWRHKALFPELPGDFIILKLSDDINVNDLDYDTFGVYFALYYLSAEELESWKTNNGL